MNHTQFAVSRFENRNGVGSWRVEGRIHGIRIRRNFKTREDAAAERAALELKALQNSAGLRPILTDLSESQAREAEAAFRRIAGKEHPLLFWLDYALANYREPRKQRPLADAISEYVAAKKHQHEQACLSITQFSRIIRDLRRLQNFFPGASVADLSPEKLIGFLEQGRPALKTYNNLRGIVATFVKFSFLRGWIPENPIQRVPQHRIRRRRGVAKTLSADQAGKLMESLETFDGGQWVPYFALCLFAGIRPSVPDGEIARLRPGDIDLDKGEIFISDEVSKVGEPRKVKIQPNLGAWLRAYPPGRIAGASRHFYKRRAMLGKELGLSHDALRHTFISMFVAKFRSIGEAAIQAGNSESIIRRHYLDLKDASEAEQFFSIVPKLRHEAKIAAMPEIDPGDRLCRPQLNANSRAAHVHFS